MFVGARFITPTADLSALSGCSGILIILFKVIIAPWRGVEQSQHRIRKQYLLQVLQMLQMLQSPACILQPSCVLLPIIHPTYTLNAAPPLNAVRTPCAKSLLRLTLPGAASRTAHRATHIPALLSVRPAQPGRPSRHR